MTRTTRLLAGAIVVALSAPVLVTGLSQAATVGDLTQLAGLPGCRAEKGYANPAFSVPAQCQTDANLKLPWGVVISPDGAHAYVTAYNASSVLSYSRASDGSLTPLAGTAGCISSDSDGSNLAGCSVANATGRQIDHVHGLAISPDGLNVYTTKDSAVAVFSRNPSTGALTQLAGAAGCVTQATVVGCTDARGMGNALGIAVSPDGASVYVTGADGVAVFDRAVDGSLTQKATGAGCIAAGTSEGCTALPGLSGSYGVAVSPDGTQVAVVANSHDSLYVFPRSGSGELNPVSTPCFNTFGGLGCVDDDALDGAQTVAFTADGKSVYVGSYPASDVGRVVVFDRDPTTHAVTKASTPCVSDDGSDGVTADACVNAHRLTSVSSLAASADGADVYAVGPGTTPNFSGTLSIFHRDGTGTLSQTDSTDGCLDEYVTFSSWDHTASCQRGIALEYANAVAVSPDDQNVYVTSTYGLSIYTRAGEDTSPPETTITGGPGGKTADRTPTFAFSASEAGATFTCRIDAGAQQACTSPFTTSTLGGGAHTFAVVATDLAQNVDPSAAVRSFTVVLPPAKPNLSTAPSLVKVGATRTFSYPFTAGKGLTGTFVLKKGTKVVVSKAFTVPSTGKVVLSITLPLAVFKTITKAKPLLGSVTVTVKNIAGTAKASKSLTVARK